MAARVERRSSGEAAITAAVGVAGGVSAVAVAGEFGVERGEFRGGGVELCLMLVGRTESVLGFGDVGLERGEFVIVGSDRVRDLVDQVLEADSELRWLDRFEVVAFDEEAEPGSRDRDLDAVGATRAAAKFDVDSADGERGAMCSSAKTGVAHRCIDDHQRLCAGVAARVVPASVDDCVEPVAAGLDAVGVEGGEDVDRGVEVGSAFYATGDDALEAGLVLEVRGPGARQPGDVGVEAGFAHDPIVAGGECFDFGEGELLLGGDVVDVAGTVAAR